MRLSELLARGPAFVPLSGPLTVLRRSPTAPLLAFVAAFTALGALGVGALGCRDLSRFSSHGDGFEGPVVKGSFVRSGVDENARVCVTLDTDHLQDRPGALWSSDGRFLATPLRPIPQLWHDALSTLAFGEGRVQNLLYVAAPTGETEDVVVVVSLLQSGNVEVRLLRGAPPATPASDADAGASKPNIFAVFNLVRRLGPCGY